MKQTSLKIRFGFLLIVGVVLLLVVRSGVWAQAGDGQTAVSTNSTQSTLQATAAISEAITYQGTLANDGSPANGSYDFRFRLYDALTGGTQLGEVLVSNVAVTNGRFTVQLDFGADAYAAGATWLEIAVDEGGYQTLTPRQPLTAVPLALSLPNVYADPATGHVGIGTSAPFNSLTQLTVRSPSTDDWGGMYVTTSGADGRPFYGYSATGNSISAWHAFNGADDEWQLYVGNSPEPDIRVDTSGNISQNLDSNGTVKAAVYATCNNSHSAISRSFNNVNETTITISNGASEGRCTIDFGFDISDRFWSATAVHTNSGRIATCNASGSQLICFRADENAAGVTGPIIVIIY